MDDKKVSIAPEAGLKPESGETSEAQGSSGSGDAPAKAEGSSGSGDTSEAGLDLVIQYHSEVGLASKDAPAKVEISSGPGVTPDSSEDSQDLVIQYHSEVDPAFRGNSADFNKTDPNASESKDEKTWQHPQAWVPRELSFLFFAAPFVFWPLAIVFGILYVYSSDMADVQFTELRNFNPPTISYVYAADGSTLAELYREHRLVVPLDEIPPVVLEAFLAAEDSNFYQHQGIDLMGLVRAALVNFQAGANIQGASTITQQMIRTFLLTNEKTYDRKLREIVLAWRVERTFTKDEILHLYLNRIYLGRGAYGVESAARLYFGKGIKDVNLAEASMLAGLVKAPSRMAAHLGTARSRERQQYVLRRMVDVGYIDGIEYVEAVDTVLNFISVRPNLYRETYPQFTEIVRRQAIGFLGKEELLTSGVKIYTTLDIKAQDLARDAVRNGLDALAKRQRLSPRVSRLNRVQAVEYQRGQREELANRPLMDGQEIAALVADVITDPAAPGLKINLGDEEGFLPLKAVKWALRGQRLDRYFDLNDLLMVRLVTYDDKLGRWDLVTAPPPDLQGSLVLMENRTGRIMAIIGGRDFGQSQFNRASQARRQPGSSFKPIVYAAAIDSGYTQASILYDSPVSYSQGRGMPPWRPKNYSRRFSGRITLYDALRSSINIPAVRLTESLTPQKVAAYARKMGIKSPLVERLPLALGASEVTLLELTQAYSTFPNQGAWSWPLFIDRIDDRHGQVVQKFDPYLTQALSPQTAYIMVDLLVGAATRGTAARVGASLRDITAVGGKTGTTNSQADALFVGFTPDYTCGVWVGRDLRISLGPGEQGGRSAAPIFIEFMKGFLADKEKGKFKVPSGVTRRTKRDMKDDDIVAMTGRHYVFKVSDVGRGRAQDDMRAQSHSSDKVQAASMGSSSANFSTMSERELDNRLLDYLKDYETRRGAN